LHCHCNASDGRLSPEQVMQEVIHAQLDLFALTDHDTVAGFVALEKLDKPFVMVSGIELSSVWAGTGVHIVGLDFIVEHPAMQAIINDLRQARELRAYQIDKKLASKGMPDSLQGALQFCPDL